MAKPLKPLADCAPKATVTVERALADRAREIIAAKAETQEHCIAATWRAIEVQRLSSLQRHAFASALRKALEP